MNIKSTTTHFDPVYYKDRLMSFFGCTTLITLLKRLEDLGIPYMRKGKDVYVFHEHIKTAFEPKKTDIVHYKSENNLLDEIEKAS